MRTLTLAALAVAAALAQVALAPDHRGAPVLPVALVAGWVAHRHAHASVGTRQVVPPATEAWPGVLAAALVLGALSSAATGWFLLALLPTPLLASAAGEVLRRRALLAAALGSVAGAVCYVVIIALASGRPGTLFLEAPTLARGLAWSAVLAMLAALALVPFRPRPRGLFE